MTLVRDGWIDGRGYYVIRDAETGEPVKYLCEQCEGELQPDPDVFVAHNCENYKDTAPVTVDATEAAMDRARELGVTLAEIEGTGQDGRVLVSDVEREA